MRFEPATPGLTLLRQTATTPVVYVKKWNFYRERPTPVYTPLCTGECITRLVPGEHRFAVGRPGSDPVMVDGPVRITGPSELRAEYVDRSGLRTAGAIVAVAGPLGGLAMVLAGTYQGGGNVCDVYGSCSNLGDDNNLTLRAAGALTVVGTLLVGTALLAQNDGARVELVPLAVAPSARRETPYQVPITGFDAQGAALQWRF